MNTTTATITNSKTENGTEIESGSGSGSGIEEEPLLFTFTGTFGNHNQTRVLVLINNTIECTIVSLNSTMLECTVPIDSFNTQSNNNNVDGEYLELYVEVDGHSYVSNDIIYILYPFKPSSSSSSDDETSSSSSSSSNTHLPNGHGKSNNTMYYLIAFLGAGFIAGIVVAIKLSIDRNIFTVSKRVTEIKLKQRKMDHLA
ncbi:hypothetical protein DFA_03089 [Cavenderia fasciculata]|uniref:IPT/TIG domain-containing protein n=1 Tax=Cavenderia fasciculata TaxID=261658 RepID=F4PGL0_CACFS|nr:uncharacterized protein DFA_03089 [Cavenderia fasciculata]EGG24844.1 hypothetical protein DFA_03089 [Cavenderia fasciculata]|eukprot:XP_004362695.1 hypothetical protein DFA_03089 [Cavenderia fasciculata]